MPAEEVVGPLGCGSCSLWTRGTGSASLSATAGSTRLDSAPAFATKSGGSETRVATMTRRSPLAMAAVGLSASALALPIAASADAAAGAKLAAARCMSCHSSTDTTHLALPLLEGQPKAYFLAQWRAFRQRERTAPVMAGLASELREDQVNDLAEYYAAQSPPPSSKTGCDLGRSLVDRLQCAECHGPALQGTNAGAARLAGQRARYIAWSLQLMRGGNRSHANAKPDLRLASLSNEEIDALAAHLESLR